MRLSRARRAWIGGVAALVLAGLAIRHWLAADPRGIFARADAAVKAGRFAEADAELRRLERLIPPTPVARFLRADVAVGLERPEEALPELAAIPDDHPLAPLARLMTGQIQIRRGLTRPAEAAFLASLKLYPRGVQARKELVFIYNIQHRQAELDAMLDALLDLDALNFKYVLHWTKTRNTIWNASGDLSSLQDFVRADPEDRQSRLALVEALRRLHRLDEAERALARLPPTDPAARTKRILIAMDRGDFATAESLLAPGSDDDPELAPLRGQLCLSRHDGQAAIRHFRIALAAHPRDRMTLSGLGTALRMVGATVAAQPYLDAAGRHDALWALVARASTANGEKDPELPHQLGMACAAVGRDQEARAWLKLAIGRNPLDAGSQHTLFELEHRAASR